MRRTSNVILLAAKRGANLRHLANIRSKGGLEGKLCLAGVVGVPALDNAALNACPFDDVLAVHLSRRRSERSWLFANVFVRRIYLALLHFYTHWLFLSWVRRLRWEKPRALVLWNGHRMPESAVRAAGQFVGVQIIYIENGCLPNTRTVDARGVNAFSSIPRDPEFYRQQSLNAVVDERWKLVPRIHHPAKHVRRDRNGLPERFILVAFQVDTDSQIVLHSPWIRDMRELFDTVCDAYRNTIALDPSFADMCVVFKEHPTSPYTYPDLHGRVATHDRFFFRNTTPTQTLLEEAEAVVTVNSTVGIEALLFGKPVITLGNAFYNIPGLVLHAANVDELVNAFTQVSGFEPDEPIRRGLISWLRREYCVPKDSSRNGQDNWHAMAERIRKLAETSKQTMQATEAIEAAEA